MCVPVGWSIKGQLMNIVDSNQAIKKGKNKKLGLGKSWMDGRRTLALADQCHHSGVVLAAVLRVEARVRQ